MWNYHSLYEKAKHFVRKGLDHPDSDSTEVPLWCILALELLARATLARVNPVLLVDLKSEDSLLSICGITEPPNATSATTNTVLSRCTKVSSSFTDREKKQCATWMGWRNKELHTGSSPFRGLSKKDWQPEYFRICAILLAQNESDMEDFLGTPSARMAEGMIESLSKKIRDEANAEISEKSEDFRKLKPQERLKKISVGSEKANSLPKKILLKSGQFVGIRVVACPSCEGEAAVIGSAVHSSSPRDESGKFVQESTWLPVSLRCSCCDLKFIGHAYVAALGLGEPFTTKDVLDPIDYYQDMGFETEENDDDE